MRRAISSRDGSASHHPAATAAYKHGTRKRSSDPARHFTPRALTKDAGPWPCPRMGAGPPRASVPKSSTSPRGRRARRSRAALKDGPLLQTLARLPDRDRPYALLECLPFGVGQRVVVVVVINAQSVSTRRNASWTGSRRSASDYPLAREARALLRGEPEEPPVHLVVVRTEPRRSPLDRARGAREAGVDALHANRADHGVVKHDDVPARRDVRVGEDVGHRASDAERHLVALEHVLDLARRPLLAPGSDDGVDLVTVRGTLGHGGEARFGE